MNILLLGAPGSGKGTNAKILSKELKIPTISMGDMLREMIKQDEELKKKVFPYMSSGKLVPDEIVGEILKKRISRKDCENGFILDGYPRNVEQNVILNKLGVEISGVIEISVGEDEILRRLTNRKVCEKCGETFNVNFNKPKKEGVCDYCSGVLVLRPDDEAKTIKKRLKVYEEQTKPLEEFYEKQGKLFVVDGEQPVELVKENMLEIIRVKIDD